MSYTRVTLRRKEKNIESKEDVESVFREAEICRLGFCDGGEPYIVPVCFGYSLDRIFVHSAAEGRKIDIIRKNPRVCFELESNVRMKEAPKACDWSISYKSVVGAGRAVLVTDRAGKVEALKIIMQHYSKEDFSFGDADLSNLGIIRIDIDWMTGKMS